MTTQWQSMILIYKLLIKLPDFVYLYFSISVRDLHHKKLLLTKVSDRDRNVKVNKVWLHYKQFMYKCFTHLKSMCNESITFLVLSARECIYLCVSTITERLLITD